MNLSNRFNNCIIKASDVGHTYNLKNGRSEIKLFVLESMLGFRFGQFILTKRLGSAIHLKKSKKNKKKKNG